MNKKTVARFMALFNGLDTAYGTYNLKYKRANTTRKPVQEKNFEDHLTGKVGVGIVPIQSTDLCNFAAIDIDINDIDHHDLAHRIESSNIPLVVCRSKSGGAHLYYFLDKKGQKAKKVREQLAVWASFLGYGTSEIFPKQDSLAPGEVGNWINLPYHDGNNTNRMAITTDGPLSLAEFLDMAESVKSKNKSIKAKAMDDHKKLAPPCIAEYLYQGVQIERGNRIRNEVIYQIGVFIKKSLGAESVEDELMRINYDIFEKPLSTKEIVSVAKSIQKKDYNYKCDSCQPIQTACNRTICEKLTYGIAEAKIAYIDGAIGKMMLGGLTKILADPPSWLLEVNGVDLTLTTEELMDYKRIRVKVLENVDIVAPSLKKEDWISVLEGLVENKQVSDAPPDSGVAGQLKNMLFEFLQMSKTSETKEDIQRGIPAKSTIKEENVVIFRSTDFIRFLKNKKFNVPPGNKLWLIMRQIGCNHGLVRIGKPVQIWYIPEVLISYESHESTESFQDNI